MADIEVRIRNAIDRSIGTTLTSIERRSDRAANSLESLNSTLRTMASGTATQLNTQFGRLDSRLRSIETRLNANNNSLRGFNGNLGTTVLSISALSFGMREIIGTAIDFADVVDTLGSRINTMADSTIVGNRDGIFDAIFEGANEARIEVDAFSTVFRRFDNALQEFGVSQADSAENAIGLAKALQLEGASATEAASSLIQVSQALNKGKLDGDEFRSVTENTTFFVEELRKVLGDVTKGELAALSEQGLITSQVMSEALQNLSQRVKKDFDTSVFTVSQSFTILQNEIVRTLSKGERVLEVLANSILFVADNAEILIIVIKGLALALGALALKSIIASLFTFATVITSTVVPAVITATTVVTNFIGLGWGTLGLLASAAFSTMGAAIVAVLPQLALITAAAVGLTLVLRKVVDNLLSGSKAMKDWAEAGNEATRSVSQQEIEAVRAAKAAGKLGNELVNAAKKARMLDEGNLRPAKFIDKLTRKLNKAAAELGKGFSEASTELEQIQLKLRILEDPNKFNLKGTTKQFENLRKELTERKFEIEVSLGADPLAELNLAQFREVEKSIESSDKLLESLANRWLAVSNAIASGQGNASALSKELKEIEKRELKLKVDLFDDQNANAELIAIETLERFESSGVDALIRVGVEIDTLKKKLAEGTLAVGQVKNALKDLTVKELELRIKIFDQEADKQLLTTIQLLDDLEFKGTKALEEIARKQKAINILLGQNKITSEQARIEIEKLNREALKIKDIQFGDERARRSLISLNAYNESLEKIRDTGVDGFIKLNAEILAVNTALKEGLITTESFKNKMEELELERLELEFSVKGTEEARANLIKFREEAAFFEELRENGIDALTAIEGKTKAINKAREEGLIGQAKFLELQQQLGNEELGLKIELFGTEQQQAAFAFIEQFKVSMEEVRQIGINAFSSLSQGIGDATADLLLMQTQALLTGKSADGAFTSFKETLSDLGKNVLKQILSSFIQLGIQFLVNKALTKIFKLDIEDLNKKQSEAAQENRKNILANTALAIGSMVTTKAVGTAAGKALAQAYAPAAAAASLASFGANSIPAIAGIAATSAKANAAFGSGSFQEGGFTGNVATNRVAGVVHGQEFVVNAQNTARNRGLLEAMNRGFDAQSALRNSNLSPSVDLSRLRQVAPSNAPAANGGMMNNIDVVIENNIAGAEFEVTQDQDDRIRIIARQEAENSIRNNVPDLVAGELANPNSSVSSSLSSNTTAERRRA